MGEILSAELLLHTVSREVSRRHPGGATKWVTNHPVIALSPLLVSPLPSREVGQCCLHHFVQGKTATREDRGLCSGIWAHRGTPQQ